MPRTPHAVLAETKLAAPLARDDSLPRPCLTGRLDSALPARLIAAVAPAGYGKTTLLEAWSRQLGETTNVGWLSLDEADAEPARFWTYLVECLARVGVRLDDHLIDDLRTDPSSMSSYVPAVAAELARLPGRQLIVLDDLHHIIDQRLLDAVHALVMALPPSATLAATMRSMPRWPIERMRRSGSALVLGPADLRFALPETGAVLRELAPRRGLEPSAIETIHRRTDGWPALVKLAAEGLRTSDDPERLVETFDGTSAVVSGYLREEVLDRLAPPVRRFLLGLSVVERFSDQLAEALVGPLARDYLHDLASAQLLVGSAEPGLGTTVHPLVRDLALEELHRHGPGRARVLNRRAGSWHRAHGSVSPAVEHLLEAGALDEALALIEDVMEPYWQRGEEATLLRWLDLLPVEELEQRPQAAALLARSLAYHGRFDEARGWVEQASRSARTDRQRLSVIVAAIYLERASGDVEATQHQVAALGELAGHVDDPDLSAAIQSRQVESLLARAICSEVVGNAEDRRSALASFGSQRTEMSPQAAFATGHVAAWFLADDGFVAQAQRESDRAMSLAAHRRATAFHGVAYSRLGRGRIAWCRGDLTTAEAEVRSAERLDRGRDAPLRITRMVLAAEVLASAGGIDHASEKLNAAWDSGEAAYRARVFQLWAAGWGIWIAGAHSDPAGASRWLRTVEQAGFVAHLPPAVWARAMIVRQEPNRVVDRFGADGLQLPAQPLPFVRAGLMLESALRQQGRRAEAAGVAARVASFAVDNDIVQPLVDEPEALRYVDLDALSPAVRTFAGAITAQHGSVTPRAPFVKSAAGHERFTERELDVIRYLPTRMTNKAIASQLSVSLNTVKSHLRSIYRKLAVSSRQEAIERLSARDPSERR